MFLAAIFWIIGDIMGAFGFGRENVGNIAHLSGIAIGLIYGVWFLLKKGKVREKKKKVEIPETYIEEWERRYVR